MEGWLAGLESSDLAALMRSSRWVYPVVSILHIFGIALAIGSVVALDVRLLGLRRRLPVSAVARFLLPFSLAGLAIAVLAGILLFVGRPGDYAANPVFRVKMVLLVLVLINATFLRRRALHMEETDTILRVGAVTSLVLWGSILVCGRLIAYSG